MRFVGRGRRRPPPPTTYYCYTTIYYLLHKYVKNNFISIILCYLNNVISVVRTVTNYSDKQWAGRWAAPRPACPPRVLHKQT